MNEELFQKKEEKQETRLHLKVGNYFVTSISEFMSYEIPDREDCKTNKVFNEIMMTNLLDEFDKAYDFHDENETRLPKYTPEEHLYWSGKPKPPNNIKEVAVHYENLFGCSVEIVKIHIKHTIERSMETITSLKP